MNVANLERAVLPLATIGAATYLMASGVLDTTAGVALLGTAAGVGHLTILGGRPGGKPPTPQ